MTAEESGASGETHSKEEKVDGREVVLEGDDVAKAVVVVVTAIVNTNSCRAR